MAKQDDYVRYTIRVPRPLYARVEKAAAQSERSVNGEIVAALEEQFPTPPDNLFNYERWFELISSAKNRKEREHRIAEANAALAQDPFWRKFRFKLAQDREEEETYGPVVLSTSRRADTA